MRTFRTEEKRSKKGLKKEAKQAQKDERKAQTAAKLVCLIV